MCLSPPAVLKLVAHQVPRRHLEEVVLGARLFSPQEACLVGLVDEVVDDALAAARGHLEALAHHPPAGYAAAKRALRAGVFTVPEEERRRFEREDLPIWSSDALRRRIRAHLAG